MHGSPNYRKYIFKETLLTLFISQLSYSSPKVYRLEFEDHKSQTYIYLIVVWYLSWVIINFHIKVLVGMESYPNPLDYVMMHTYKLY